MNILVGTFKILAYNRDSVDSIWEFNAAFIV